MAIFVNDTFTEASTVNLVDHVGETGATWTLHPSYSDIPVLVAGSTDSITTTANGTSAYYASGVPAGAEYDVECDVELIGSSNNTAIAGVIGRADTTADTFYNARYNSSGGVERWELYKSVAGVFTLLGTYSQTLNVSQAYHLRLEITDASKKVFIDGVERISSTDNAITAAGRAGLRWATSLSSQFNYRIDNFSGTDIGGGGATVTVNQASETDAAFNIAPVKPITVAIGQAAEVGSAFGVTPLKPIAAAVGQATETDVAFSIAPVKPITAAVGQAVEIDAAFGVTPVLEAGQTVAVGQAVEADAAFSVTPVKPIIVTIGQAIETDTAFRINAITGAAVDLPSVTLTSSSDLFTLTSVSALFTLTGNTPTNGLSVTPVTT